MIEKIPFGRTGHDSSRVIFGAAALGSVGQAQGDELLPILDEYGVDGCADAVGLERGDRVDGVDAAAVPQVGPPALEQFGPRRHHDLMTGFLEPATGGRQPPRKPGLNHPDA